MNEYNEAISFLAYLASYLEANNRAIIVVIDNEVDMLRLAVDALYKERERLEHE